MSNAPVRRRERSEKSRCVKCHRPIGATRPKVVIGQFEFHSNCYAAHLRCLEITLKNPDTHPDGNAIQIERYGIRYWAVWDAGTLVCVCLYKKGAREVKRRLEARVPLEDDPSSPQRVASRPSASGG
jgi:hypothetical protein